MKNQKEEILKYCRTHKKGITTWTALEIGIARLSERIRELEQDGFIFEREPLAGKNRYGNTVRVVRYRLVSS